MTPDYAMNTDSQLQRDIATVEKITAVPMILDIVCKTTGMGFAAVARVARPAHGNAMT